MKRRLLRNTPALLCLALGACAGAMPYDAEEASSEEASGAEAAPGEAPRTDESEGGADDYAQRIVALRTALDSELLQYERGQLAQSVQNYSRSDGPGPCGDAADLRDRICDLASRICRIADDHPDDGGVDDKCAAARESCAGARADVSRSCGQR